jgi:hypothetical protein
MESDGDIMQFGATALPVLDRLTGLNIEEGMSLMSTALTSRW